MDWSSFVREHFCALAESNGIRGPVGTIVALLASGRLSLASYDAHVTEHGLEREEWFRKQRLDLILGLVSSALEKGALALEHEQELARLKLALRVEEGEFAALRPVEIATILRQQLEVLLEDGEIDHAEDLYQVQLQRAFDLGYDDYLSLGRGAFESAMRERLERQVIASKRDPEAYERISRQIVVLEPIYRLATARPRTPGALY